MFIRMFTRIVTPMFTLTHMFTHIFTSMFTRLFTHIFTSMFTSMFTHIKHMCTTCLPTCLHTSYQVWNGLFSTLSWKHTQLLTKVFLYILLGNISPPRPKVGHILTEINIKMSTMTYSLIRASQIAPRVYAAISPRVLRYGSFRPATELPTRLTIEAHVMNTP